MKKAIASIYLLMIFTLTSHLSAQVKSGLDVLVAEGFRSLHGKRVGLVINHTAVDRQGRSIVSLFAECPHVKIAALFGPEHGVSGRREAGEQLTSATDSLTGAPVFSLYGKTNKPTPDMLKGVDVLVFDMQDVGVRFYTYISTMFYTMEAAAEAHIAFMVLDRPNPVAGVLVEGPVLKMEFASFVGIKPIPVRHGMTFGELARLFNGERWLADKQTVDLTVVAMRGWRREMFFTETGLPWINPSPNITSPHCALLYPGMCLLEATNVSEGRGTTRPFEWVGAPWMDAEQIMAQLGYDPEILKISAIEFTPVNIPNVATNPKFQGRCCHGLSLQVLQPDRFLSYRFGLQLLTSLRKLYPDSLRFQEKGMNRLTGDDAVLAGLQKEKPVAAILRSSEKELLTFKRLREKYLLY